jgi:hypothetical protein
MITRYTHSSHTVNSISARNQTNVMNAMMQASEKRTRENFEWLTGLVANTDAQKVSSG